MVMLDMVSQFLEYFSNSLLYVVLGWFGVMGYFAHAVVLMIITRLQFEKIMSPLLKLHVISLLLSYVVAPFGAVALGNVYALVYEKVPSLFMHQALFVSFVMTFMYGSLYWLCAFFSVSSCRKFQTSLLICDTSLAVLGYLLFMKFYQ